MVSILSRIDAKEWDIEEGKLDPGTEIIVNGEKSFEQFKTNSFWGKVKCFHSDGKCKVVTTDGTRITCSRNTMRKHVLKSLAVGGVLNDNLHDRYHQQHFTKIELKWFEEYLKTKWAFWFIIEWPISTVNLIVYPCSSDETDPEVF